MDWSTLLAGALIGGLISYVIDKLLTFIENQTFIRLAYKGEFYSYRYATTDADKLVSHRWKIARKLNGSIGVTIEELNHENPFKYKGAIRVKDRFIYVHLRGINHSEEMFYIFPEPIDKKITAIRGVLVAISMEGKPWSGNEVLVSEPLSPQKAGKLLTERT